MVAKIENTSPTVARYFDVSCTWECPSNTGVFGGVKIVNNGTLEGHGRMTYKSLVKINCDPIPSALTLSCRIAPHSPASNVKEVPYSSLSVLVP
jgi:hypothetical protein